LLSSFLFIAPGKATDDVRLFQDFFRDAPVATSLYGEAGIQYSDYDGASSLFIGARGGYPLTSAIELNTNIGFINFDVENGDGESGISDILLACRYNFKPDLTKVSAGGYITLPTGDEDIWQGKLNFGGFGALRYPLDNGIAITGNAGLDFLETKKYKWTAQGIEEETEHETSFHLGAGVIVPIPGNDKFHVVGEFNMDSEGDFLMLTAGADYRLSMASRIRAGFGLGLDDGAPDFQLTGTFFHSF
jgi:hypothetical protein